MSFSKGGNAQKTTQNNASSTSVDPQTMAWMQQIMKAAQGAGAAGPSSLVTGATGYNTGLMGAGNTGIAALSGDKTALAGLMDPYQHQVIDATNAQWDNADQRATNGVNAAATSAGAFGGGRQGVVQANTMAANNLNRNSQIGGLLSSGYGDAMGRAGQLAGMGFAGAGANANLGMGGVGSPQQWLLNMLKQGFLGPTGSNTGSSGAQTTFGGNYSASINPLAMFGGGG